MSDLGIHSSAEEGASIPSEGLSVSVGQWVIVKGSWRDELGEVTKASDKQVRTRRYGDREAHHQRVSVIFAGTEKEARDLLSVLNGLGIRNERNRQQLNDQHRASRAAAIAKATRVADSASPSHGGDEADAIGGVKPKQPTSTQEGVKP